MQIQSLPSYVDRYDRQTAAVASYCNYDDAKPRYETVCSHAAFIGAQVIGTYSNAADDALLDRLSPLFGRCEMVMPAEANAPPYVKELAAVREALRAVEFRHVERAPAGQPAAAFHAREAGFENIIFATSHLEPPLRNDTGGVVMAEEDVIHADINCWVVVEHELHHLLATKLFGINFITPPARRSVFYATKDALDLQVLKASSDLEVEDKNGAIACLEERLATGEAAEFLAEARYGALVQLCPGLTNAGQRVWRLCGRVADDYTDLSDPTLAPLRTLDRRAAMLVHQTIFGGGFPPNGFFATPNLERVTFEVLSLDGDDDDEHDEGSGLTSQLAALNLDLSTPTRATSRSSLSRLRRAALAGGQSPRDLPASPGTPSPSPRPLRRLGGDLPSAPIVHQIAQPVFARSLDPAYAARRGVYRRPAKSSTSPPPDSDGAGNAS